MDSDFSVLENAGLSYRVKSNQRPRQRYGRQEKLQDDFSCLHCRGLVSVAAWLSGVQNRNHCPYCLYSRHVDLFQAGDRMAVCRAEMKPVGLTMKITRKKYESARSGELMLIHVCADCGKISINRLAADDDARTAFEVFEGSHALDAGLRLKLEINNIRLLEPGELEIVSMRLFGQN